jgi:hypothetical protein
VSEDLSHAEELAERKRIARIVKQRLGFLIALLTVVALVLIFRIEEGSWPIWIIEHRRQILGADLLALALLALWSPIMIEASSNSRVLSGSKVPWYLHWH